MAFDGVGYQFSITTLRYPTVEPVIKRKLFQFWDGETEIELNELRTAKVTISMYDPACEDILPLERFLRVRYLGEVIFWGPMLEPDWNFDESKVTINAIDEGYRMVKHFVRIGDAVETDEFTTVDHRGVLALRDCALNTAGQTARGVPDLGIGDGTTDVPDVDIKLKITRGDEVWATIGDLAESLDNPFDVELVPQEIGQGNYALVNTYIKQGTDKSTTLKFHYNWGKSNLDKFSSRPSGSVVVTHDHVLSQDLEHRGTAAAEGPSARFGPYVKWDALSRNVDPSEPDPDAILAGFGKGTVMAYGEPPKFFTFSTRLDTGDSNVPTYGRDFLVGDLGHVVAKKGYGFFNEQARIRKVTIKQANYSKNMVYAEIEAVPTILISSDVNSPED